MVTTKWIKRAILWCFRFSLALGGQCVIFGIILFCGFSDIHPLIKEHATLQVEATFSRYELACGNASSYPENVTSSRRVGTCRFCMQNLIKKNFTFIFTKKIILIPLELKLLLNDKMINYKQKRQVNFTSIKESPYWLNNFPKHHPSYESVLNFVRPIYLLSFLIVFLFMFGSISFVACIFRSTDQLTAELTKLCVAFVTLLSFSYIFLSGLFHRTTLRSCSTELYKSVVRQLKCWKNPVDARLQSWLILWITKLLKRMVPTQRDSSLYKIEKSCTREEQGRITISYGR